MKRLFLTAVTASLLSSAFLISVPAAQAEEAAYKLVLLRHGESQWNLEKRFTGWSDIDLTDKGRAGAVKAGEIMKGAGVNFDEVHTSKLNRAIETAQLAQKGMSAQWVPLQKFWRLNERCYGDLEGKKREDVAKEVGDDQVKIWRRSFDVPPPFLHSILLNESSNCQTRRDFTISCIFLIGSSLNPKYRISGLILILFYQ